MKLSRVGNRRTQRPLIDDAFDADLDAIPLPGLALPGVATADPVLIVEDVPVGDFSSARACPSPRARASS